MHPTVSAVLVPAIIQKKPRFGRGVCVSTDARGVAIIRNHTVWMTHLQLSAKRIIQIKIIPAEAVSF